MIAKNSSGFWITTDGRKTVRTKQTACSCGCGLNAPSQAVIDMLGKLIDAIDNNENNFICQSGCRCLISNNELSNASKTSAHLPDADGICHALDLSNIKNNAKTLLVFARGLFQNQFGIGYYPLMNIIHIDDRAEMARWLFVGEYKTLTNYDLWTRYINDRNI